MSRKATLVRSLGSITFKIHEHTIELTISHACNSALPWLASGLLRVPSMNPSLFFDFNDVRTAFFKDQSFCRWKSLLLLEHRDLLKGGGNREIGSRLQTSFHHQPWPRKIPRFNGVFEELTALIPWPEKQDNGKEFAKVQLCCLMFLLVFPLPLIKAIQRVYIHKNTTSQLKVGNTKHCTINMAN